MIFNINDITSSCLFWYWCISVLKYIFSFYILLLSVYQSDWWNAVRRMKKIGRYNNFFSIYNLVFASNTSSFTNVDSKSYLLLQ